MGSQSATPQFVGDFQVILDQLLEGCQVVGFDWRYLYVNDAVARQGRKTPRELIGRRMFEVYPGFEKTPMFKTLERCMATRTPARILNEFSHADGGTGWFELSVQPVAQGLFIMSLDMTKHKEAERHAAVQVERLDALRAIDRSILSTPDWRVAIQTVVEAAQTKLAVDVAAVLFLNPQTGLLELAASAGWGADPAAPLRLAIGDGLAGRAARDRRIVSVDDSGWLDPSDPIRTLVEASGQSVHAAPLLAEGKPLGVLVVAIGQPSLVTGAWLSFLEALAGQAAMAINSGEAFAQLERANRELAAAYDTTLEGWTKALDLRDRETEGHSQRVTETTLRLARMAGVAESELVHVRRGALLHDIGKLGVPDSILLKPGPLTQEEWSVMRRHPDIAHDLLRPITFLHAALEIPYCHHERWDGGGYPRGLRHDEIPLAARLFAVVDVWDALSSDRPYRQRWRPADVHQYLTDQSGAHFDPEAVDAFFDILRTSDLP
jgi:PAS domain S-box-containing protein